MSRATNQALILLAMVNGTLKLMEACDYHDDGTESTGMYASELCEKIIYNYPATGNEQKNFKWMHEKFKLWSDLIQEVDKEWHRAVLATMALNITEDLLGKIKNSARDDIEALRDALIPLSIGWAEEEKDEFILFEEADMLLNKMYALIEFSR